MLIHASAPFAATFGVTVSDHGLSPFYVVGAVAQP